MLHGDLVGRLLSEGVVEFRSANILSGGGEVDYLQYARILQHSFF